MKYINEYPVDKSSQLEVNLFKIIFSKISGKQSLAIPLQ